MPQFLNMSQLNTFLTKFCETTTPHDYNQCLLWHSNMSPNLSEEEVRSNHLRRKPYSDTNGEYYLNYSSEKCIYGRHCPNGKTCGDVYKFYNFNSFYYFTIKLIIFLFNENDIKIKNSNLKTNNFFVIGEIFSVSQ